MSMAVADELLAQPSSVRGLTIDEQNALIISMRRVDGVWIVVSRYEDDVWWTTDSPTNIAKCNTRLDFTLIPTPFRRTIKAIFFRMKSRGREGGNRMRAGSLIVSLRVSVQSDHLESGLGA